MVPELWLLFNLFSIIASAFYSMAEMACVSLNRARLHFLAVNGDKRAERIQSLLDHPSRLFGTTLIGVNAANVLGSECSRQFHEAIGLNPNLAPISQVVIVIIFGELAPMFGARHHPEQLALLSSRLLYLSSRWMAPFIYFLSLLTDGIDWILGNQRTHSQLYLSADELERMISQQERDRDKRIEEQQPLTTVASSLLTLHTLSVEELMVPLHSCPLLASHATVGELRHLISRHPWPLLPLYTEKRDRVVGLVAPHDLIGRAENEPLISHARSPWYVTSRISLSLLLHQFRHNQQRIAVVLNEEGCSIGLISFYDILKALFAPFEGKDGSATSLRHQLEVTLPASMRLEELKAHFGVELSSWPSTTTLEEVMVQQLGYSPEEEEAIQVGSYLLIVKERTTLGLKKILVTTRPFSSTET